MKEQTPKIFVYDAEQILTEANQTLGPAGVFKKLLEIEQGLSSMVRAMPTLQTKWSGSMLQKFVAPPTPAITRWVYPLKGKYIDWRDMMGKEVTLKSNNGADEITVLVLLVVVPDIWWWQSRFGDDASVIFSIKGDAETHNARLSEFVTMVHSINTPII
jgi:hypothetical protein